MIVAGHVYIVRTTLTKPPKDKIVVCICAADNLFFWINTMPRAHGVGQLKLQPSDHAALSRECYLDTSRATTFIAPELQGAQSRGLISKGLATRIVDYLANSPPKTLAPRHLQVAITNLSAIV